MAKRDSDSKAIMRIVTGAVELLKSHPAVDGEKVGVIGFSMGGGWSLWLSTQKPEDVGAVVVFYGTWEVALRNRRLRFSDTTLKQTNGSR